MAAIPTSETLCSSFQRQVAARGEAWALTMSGHRGLTWTEYGAAVRRLTPGLATLGAEPGRPVALLLGPRPEFHVVDTALLHAGAVPFSLQLLPRRGAVVVPVGPREAADVLEVRRALETAAVQRLAALGAPAQATRARLGQELDALLEAQEQLAAEGEVVAFARADAEFHRAVLAASGNAISLQFYSTLADRQRRMAVSSIGSRTGHLSTLTDEHRTLAHLVAARDADGYDSALTAHLAATHSTLLGGAS